MENQRETRASGDVRLSMKECLGYGVGDFANNMMFTPVNSFVTYFLTSISGIGAGVVGTIMLISRLMDGLSDLIVGILMEKFKSKKGKARPWLLWWCIPFAVSLVLLFTAPDFGMTGKIIYAFLTYNLAVTIVYTAINLPFGALAALITRNQTERGYLNISKMTFAFAGGLFCNMATLPLVDFFGGGSRGWQLTFLCYGVIAVILFLVVYFSTTERVGSDAQEKEKGLDIKKALKSLLLNKYWVILLLVFFLNSFGNALIGVNVFYAQYIMNDTSLVGSIAFYMTLASFVTFAVSAKIIRRIGKQRIALAGATISLVGYAMVILAPESYPMLYISSLVKGVGNAALSGVMYGMLADTVEYNEWKSGIRAEGLVFSANSIGSKVGSGLGAAALGWILAFFGFVSKSGTQPELAIEGIRIIFLYVPLLIFGAMIVLLCFYRLDKIYDQVIEELTLRTMNK